MLGGGSKKKIGLCFCQSFCSCPRFGINQVVLLIFLVATKSRMSPNYQFFCPLSGIFVKSPEYFD